MKVKILTKTPQIHTTCLYEIHKKDNKFLIYFDDISEKRWILSFNVIQAIQITTIDCFDIEPFIIKESISNGIYHRHILEIEESDKIKELKGKLKQHDEKASFMEKSHHYLLILDDDILEIIAWDNYELEKINRVLGDALQ